MPLILRAVKGSKLTISEMDGNLLWLAENISGSGIISVTGSGIDASNTPITSSFFVGNGSQLTNVTASFVTASNVYGPYGASSVLSASFAANAPTAATASFVTASNVYGPYGSNSIISASYAETASYAIGGSIPTLQQVTTVGSGSINPIELQNSNNTFTSLKLYNDPYTGGTSGKGVIELNFSGNSRKLTLDGEGIRFKNTILGESLLKFDGGGNYSVSLPDSPGTLVLKVNGVSADTSGSITISTGSITTPGGSDTQIQFNSGSVFAGDAGFTYNYLSQSLQQGNNTQAIGIYSHAEGRETLSSGQYSHAEGWLTTASANYTHAEGRETNATQIYSHTEGGYTRTTGAYSHAEGWFTTASGTGAHAEGSGSIAQGNYSHAEGDGTRAIGLFSHAEGFQTLASDQYDHAEGYQVTASGYASHAEGANTKATGAGSHAEGQFTQATNAYAHAEGRYNIASGVGSHAEGGSSGNPNTARGEGSHAEGEGTVAHGSYSHAGGYGTIASGSWQTVYGQFNTQNNTTDVFVVGVGPSAGSRLDGFAVTPSGSILVLTQSAAPTWTGREGEIVPAVVSGNYRIYIYLGGAWRSSSLS